MDKTVFVVTWPDGHQERYPFQGDRLRIGRSNANDIAAPNFATISENHAEIKRVGDKLVIADLGSTNGTFVNDQQIEDQFTLSPGQRISVGSLRANQQITILVEVQAAENATKEQFTGTRRALSQPNNEAIPYLVVRYPSGETTRFYVQDAQVIVGRDPRVDIVLPDEQAYVSGRHFEIRREGEGYTLADLGSTNGTRVNNTPLVPNQPTPIRDNDIIRIGKDEYGVSISFTFHVPTEAKAPVEGFGGATQMLQIHQEVIRIGRDSNCDIILDSPKVARLHAMIERIGDSNHLLKVVDQSVGVLVNGAFVTRQAALKPGDLVEIGPHLLTYDGQTLQRYDSQGYRLDVVDVFKEVNTPNGKLRILDDITFTIMPREFVALVGGSGAGKSTLLDALNGFRPAQGQIVVNQRDFYKDYDDFRTQLGYVPQYDILPNALRVEEALEFAARLRLPPDVSAQERADIITRSLDTVGMNTEKVRNTRIRELSGGQRKRVSIAAELLADPKLFFLDEPTSGLDPGLEKKMMYTLRNMADEGRTIILITHATSNIVQVDHVAFLSQGKLVFFGPPAKTQNYFEVNDFADIYEKIERHGEAWRQTFTQDKREYYEEFVLQRSQAGAGQPAIPDKTQAPKFTAEDNLRQLQVLAERMFRLTLRDPISLFVSLVVMPLVAIFLITVASPDIIVGDPDIIGEYMPGDIVEEYDTNYLPASNSHTILFLVSLLAVLVGAFGGSNELIKERSIYLRERMVNLKLIPYIGSKFIVFTGFALVQSALFLFILALRMRFPDEGALLPLPGIIEIYITLVLTTVVGVAIGLFVSSVSVSNNMALYIVLTIIFFQFIFAGAFFNIRGEPTEVVSTIAAARWSTIALGTTVDVNELTESSVLCAEVPSPQGTETVCQLTPVDDETLLLPYGDSAGYLLLNWGLLIGLGAIFTALAFFFTRRLDYIEVRLA
ncbi:MAG: FHA domain-containing protein [Anaerolineales bacterium]